MIEEFRGLAVAKVVIGAQYLWNSESMSASTRSCTFQRPMPPGWSSEWFPDKFLEIGIRQGRYF